LDESDKPRTVDDIDRIVSAEISDPVTHPLAHETVIASIIYSPYDLLNPETVCMKNGKCSKNYTFNFSNTITSGDKDGVSKLTYRRRPMQNKIIPRNNGYTTVDNRRVVLHNLYLAEKHNAAHINVEICNQVNSIKYVYKDHDFAHLYMDSNATE
jgi:hypothetical protein